MDGKPIELDESSVGLVENGLLVVIEFNRIRVLDRSELGDEDSATSSEVLRVGLYLCDLFLARIS